MGISGLLPLLKEIQVHGNIKDFKGKRLAVDAYVWLHKGAFGCAEDLIKGKRTTKFVDYAMYRVRLLRHHGITPFIVFDGGPLPAKKGTEVSRAKSRAENLARASSLESQGRYREAREYYTKCVDITPEMAYQLIKALRAEAVDYVVAPYEADAQLFYLEREGYVDGIITEDSDLLVFGCKQVIFKLDGDGNCVSIHRDKLATVSQFPMDGWTDTQFRRMAMLSGCDYLPSISGIGLKTAHRLLRRLKTVEKVLSSLRLEGAHKVPDDYIQAFNQAELAFMYQRVFCLKEKRLMPLNEFPEAGLSAEDERWIGLDVSIEIAQGMANGDIHPETRVPIVDEWPDFKPVSRGQKGVGEGIAAAGPSRRPGTILAESSKGNRTTGPMDAFVQKRIMPKPVGAPCSGPARLSELSTLPAQVTPDENDHQPNAQLGRQGRRRDLPQRSKFFGSGSAAAALATAVQPSRRNQLTKWPSGEGEAAGEDSNKLVWEKSDEAGPEVDVDIDSPDKGRKVALAQTPTPGHGVWSSPVRSPSPMVSSLRVDSSPSRRVGTACHVRRTARYSDSPTRDSADAPHFSSPPATSPPPRPSAAAGAEYTLSSPPDVGRERSCTADAFSPTPSPKRVSQAPIPESLTPDPTRPTPGEYRNVPVPKPVTEANSIRQTVIVPRTSSPSPSIPPHPNSDTEALVSSAKRLKRAKTHLGIPTSDTGTGSSDSIDTEDDEVVTPSFDAARWKVPARPHGLAQARAVEGVRSDRQLCIKRSLQAASSCDVAQEADGAEIIMVDHDHDEDDDNDETAAANARETMRMEEERRKESARVVASGWRDKFTMRGKVNGRSSSPAPPEPSLKRRKTDPTVPPWSPLTPPTLSTPRPQLAAAADARSNSRPRTVPAGLTNIQVSKRTGPNMPLSAFAPRVLTVRSSNLPDQGGVPTDPDSPLVRRINGKDAMAAMGGSKGGAENRLVSVSAAVERGKIPAGLGESGGLARFAFTGEVERVREVL